MAARGLRHAPPPDAPPPPAPPPPPPRPPPPALPPPSGPAASEPHPANHTSCIHHQQLSRAQTMQTPFHSSASYRGQAAQAAGISATRSAAFPTLSKSATALDSALPRASTPPWAAASSCLDSCGPPQRNHPSPPQRAPASSHGAPGLPLPPTRRPQGRRPTPPRLRLATGTPACCACTGPAQPAHRQCVLGFPQLARLLRRLPRQRLALLVRVRRRAAQLVQLRARTTTHATRHLTLTLSAAHCSARARLLDCERARVTCHAAWPLAATRTCCAVTSAKPRGRPAAARRDTSHSRASTPRPP